MAELPVIVIVGGGFGGIHSAKEISSKLKGKARIVLINKNNYFLFTPMLHEVATGGLNHTLIIESIREVLGKCPVEFIKDEVTSINPKEKTVSTPNQKIKYDYLVVATGATTNDFNIKGVKENTTGLKTINDALKIRSQILHLFEQAAAENDINTKKKLLNFVVIGGGATGVELVAELAEFVNDTLVDCYDNIKREYITITVINSNADLVPYFSPRLRAKTKSYLEKIGVNVLNSSYVSSVGATNVVLDSGKKIPFSLCMWTAGVKASYPSFLDNISTDKAKRIEIDAFLRCKEYKEIYVIGDAASGQPMLAYVAVRQAGAVADNICNTFENKKLKEFEFKQDVQLLSLGQDYAVGSFYGREMSGRYVWFIWRTVYLFKIFSIRKKNLDCYELDI